MAEDPLIESVIDGRYRVLSKLGEGGMGAVYRAEHTALRKVYALKVLRLQSNDAEAVGRFDREARAAAHLEHRNIARCHHVGMLPDGGRFLVMDLVEGESLANLLARERRLEPARALPVLSQVAQALACAHDKQIVHRDLKPENIMIRKGLRGMHAKVLDFGIARLMDASTKLTVAGAIAGTPRYMSPEQVEGREVDRRADIYSLGIVCFEALTGRQPFDGATIAEIMRKQALEPLPRLSDIAPEIDLPALQAVLDKACAKNREQRYPDMIAFASALSQAIPTQLHMSLPPLQRMATNAGRAAVAAATPAPGKATGMALPGTNAGAEALDSTMLQGSTPAPSVTIQDSGQSALTQQPGIGSISPSGSKSSVPDVSLPPRVEKSKAPLIAGVVVLLVLIGGGVAVMAGGKDPGPQPNVPEIPKVVEVPKPIEPPKVDDTATIVAAAAAKVVHEQAAYEKLKSAQTNWEKGDLNTAKIDLDNIATDTPARAEAEKLLANIKIVQDAITAGDKARQRGDCDAAMSAYRNASKLNGNVDAVKRGMGACTAAAIPGQAE